jgi:hypothetical protein
VLDRPVHKLALIPAVVSQDTVDAQRIAASISCCPRAASTSMLYVNHPKHHTTYHSLGWRRLRAGATRSSKEMKRIFGRTGLVRPRREHRAAVMTKHRVLDNEAMPPKGMVVSLQAPPQSGPWTSALTNRVPREYIRTHPPPVPHAVHCILP